MRNKMRVLAHTSLLAAVASLTPGVRAEAQESPFTIGSLIFAYMDPSFNVNQSCQTSSELASSPNDGSLHCTGPGMSGDGRWSTTFGALHVQTSVSATAAPAYYATMQGQSYFNDFLDFTGADLPSAVRFTVNESGTVAGSEDVTEAPLDLTSQIIGFGNARCNGADQTSTVVYTGMFNTVRSALCTFSGNSLNFGYSFYASATVDVGRSSGNLNQPLLSGAASVDAFDTGLIDGLTFYDADGTDITSNVRFTSASGANYPLAAVVTTPEPGALALCATGLLGILGVTRRRPR